VKYGGVPEVDALNFVTINPAVQLGIDDRVGSLDAGKDADFVIWSGHPLSTLTRAEQTWIDGRKYFDIAADRVLRDAAAAERSRLIQKVLQQELGDRGPPGSNAEDTEDTEDNAFDREPESTARLSDLYGSQSRSSHAKGVLDD
jgi:N-acetylglucosamine-6-phosphate deacetylase